MGTHQSLRFFVERGCSRVAEQKRVGFQFTQYTLKQTVSAGLSSKHCVTIASVAGLPSLAFPHVNAHTGRTIVTARSSGLSNI